MGVGSGLYMYDVVVKRSRSLSHLLMSSCFVVVIKKQELFLPNFYADIMRLFCI